MGECNPKTWNKNLFPVSPWKHDAFIKILKGPPGRMKSQSHTHMLEKKNSRSGATEQSHITYLDNELNSFFYSLLDIPLGRLQSLHKL